MGRCLSFVFPCLILLTFSLSYPDAGTPESVPGANLVWVFPLSGDVTPPLATTIHRWFGMVPSHSPAVIILQIDTPGGMSGSMRSIIKDILASPVPVVGYVAPSGARAASAGTYILYACPLAAMAEGTNVGSATPVPIGGSAPILPTPDQKAKSHSPSLPDAEDRKILNDSIAYIRSLAEMNGRNADWAAQAVASAANLTAFSALKMHVIDLVAPDIPTLLKKIEGRTLRFKGQEITLQLQPATIRTFVPGWKDRLLEILANPELAYLLFLLGIVGLAFEFSHPGFIVPGVAGLLSLIMALYAFTILPVNLTGILLLLLGLSLMVAEVLIGAFGGLAVAGILAFFLGSLLFFRTPSIEGPPPVHPSWTLLLFLTLFVAFFFLGIIRLALKSRIRPVLTGIQSLKGEQGTAMESFQKKGRVKLHSEIWWAISPVPVREGDNVVIEGISGLTLKVRPVSEEAP